MNTTDTIALLIGISAVAVGGLALARTFGSKSAAPASGGGWGNSDEYPYSPGSLGAGGGEGNDPARVGYGTTEPENAAANEVLTASIPGELVSMDDWYERRNIGEVLGISPAEYRAGWERVLQIPGNERSAEANYAYGYTGTLEQGRYMEARNALIAQDGGGWVNGVLQVPTGYQGSVTQYSNDLKKRLEEAGY